MPRTLSANPACGRREALAVEVEHIVAAIGKGLLSPALSTRLQAAEQELATLSSAESVINAEDVLRLIGPAVEAYRRRVTNLPETIRKAPDVARKVIRDGVGPIVVEPRDGYLVAKMGLELQPLLAAIGVSIDVVAGQDLKLVCFVSHADADHDLKPQSLPRAFARTAEIDLFR